MAGRQIIRMIGTLNDRKINFEDKTLLAHNSNDQIDYLPQLFLEMSERFLSQKLNHLKRSMKNQTT